MNIYPPILVFVDCRESNELILAKIKELESDGYVFMMQEGYLKWYQQAC